MKKIVKVKFKKIRTFNEDSCLLVTGKFVLEDKSKIEFQLETNERGNVFAKADNIAEETAIDAIKTALFAEDDNWECFF